MAVYTSKRQLADKFQIPLINADRMMMSILPETSSGSPFAALGSRLRDEDRSWMEVAQKGVEAFVAQAMAGERSICDGTSLLPLEENLGWQDRIQN